MSEVNLTLGDPIEVKVAPAEGATNVTVSPAPQNVVQVQAAIATDGIQGADGAGVPTDPAGSTGQALVKSTDAANDTEWAYIDKLHVNVRNTTGSSIPAGSVVYAAGLQGNNVLVDLADASDPNKMPAIGFTYEDIAHNSNGDVISAGVLNQNIHDVTGADEGDILYVSDVAGEVTVVKPLGAANLVQNVGIVLKANNNIVQKFKVSAIDRTNDIPNLASGKIFLGGASNQISPYELPTTSPSLGNILVADAQGNFAFQDQSGYKANLATSDLVATGARTYQVAEDSVLEFIDAQDEVIMQISERDKSVVFKGGIEAESNLSVDGNITVVGTVDGKDVSTLLANVVEDTAPQLGGPLDLNSQGITDSTGIDLNSNVFIPTSSLHIGSTATPAESLHITNGSVKIDNGVNPYTLPSSDGSANQVISTDGSGTLTFVDQSGGLDGIVDDTAPQLGGDLDVNGRKITSTSNGDIDIEPNGTGNVLLGNFEFDVDQAVGAGQDNYVLTYDNTLGTISLEAAAGGSVDTSGTPADDQIAIFTDADTIEGDSSFTWNGTQLTVGGQANIDKISVTKGTGISAAGDFGIGSRVLTKFGAATTGLTAGDVYYLGSSAWVQADADAASSASGILAVATDTTSTPGMVKEGLVKMADSSDFSAASAGDVVYLSTAAGHVTASAPSQGGDIVRVVGYVFEPSNGIIYFDPSKDWIELV